MLFVMYLAQTTAVLDGSYNGPCLITNCTADASKVGQYATAKIFFNSTKIVWGPPGQFSYETDYQDQYTSARYGMSTVRYGAAAIMGPPGDNMGKYPTPNDYIGDLGIPGQASGTGGHLEATLDYTSQAVSGSMRWSEGSAAGSTVYACNFSGMKKE
jgi:hypothetical protein